MKSGKLYALMDSETVELVNATIALSDVNYAYGIGVYETIRMRGGKCHFSELHLERLLQSAEIIGLKHKFTLEELRNRLKKMSRINLEQGKQRDINIKIMMIRRNARDCSLYIFPTEIPRVKGSSDLAYPEPVGVEALCFRGERHFPRAKSLSMLLSTVALNQAREAGCWDALLIDREGRILEGSRSNVYWIEGNTLYTPPEKSILAGVTRHNIMKCAGEAGIETAEGELLLDELAAKPRSLLISSTSIAIQPVRRLHLEDERVLDLPESDLVDKLAAFYRSFLQDYSSAL